MMQCRRLSVICVQRYSSSLDTAATTAGTSNAVDSSSSLLDGEKSDSKNTKIVSRLTERHRLIAEGRLPPVSYEWEKELWAKRERFGTYGLASGVNPEELWPTVEEIQEEEAVEWYMKYSDVLKTVENHKKAEYTATLNRLKEVAALEDKYPEMLSEFLANRKEVVPMKSKQELEAEEQAKDMLEYYGYEVLPKDPRFPILFEKMVEAKKKCMREITGSEISGERGTVIEKAYVTTEGNRNVVMSNASGVAMQQQQQYSIVEYVGYNEGGRCGYCHREEATPTSIGMWTSSLSVSHYNELLDRGIRRSGKYLYKPMIANTCCPQYTIRLDVNNFRLSKAQKRVLRRMNDFLQKDVRPSERTKISEYNVVKRTTESSTISSNPQEKAQDEKKTLNNEFQKKGKKKKVLRRERAFQKMRDKGVNIEEAQRIRQEKEEFRRRTLESFIVSYDPETFKHKLEVRLVDSKSSDFCETFKESFKLFEKYQTNVHHDTRCNKTGYRNFLADSPLFNDERDESKSVALGSYHQQYYLDGRLIAVGVVDILPRCLSAKYLYYDPDYEFLTLGTYTALREIAFTQELAKERPQLHYYYMGFYIHSCQKMRYKQRFHPSHLLCDRSFTWVPLEKCLEMIERCGERIEAFAPDAPVAEKCPVESIRCLYKMSVLPYRILLSLPDFEETETFMEEYAQVVGPIAREMLLYRK
uniref:arginyltransferase n=1 Tax=Elaeophora elaphi TaxID=1147741 RepID=A0A158Q7V2_9BILA